MVCSLETAVGLVLGIGLMMKAAVGEGSAQPFVKEEEQESNLDALCGEGGRHSTIRLARAGLAQVVAQLV